MTTAANPQNRVSAPMTRETAHKACAQPSCAGVRLVITESQAAKIGILDRWKSVWNRKQARESRKLVISNKLQAALNQLETIAQNEHWSQRKLAAKVGLPESTLRKIKQGHADPVIWLSRVQAAATKLTTPNLPN